MVYEDVCHDSHYRDRCHGKSGGSRRRSDSGAGDVEARTVSKRISKIEEDIKARYYT